jgi:hypothetical protein
LVRARSVAGSGVRVGVKIGTGVRVGVRLGMGVRLGVVVGVVVGVTGRVAVGVRIGVTVVVVVTAVGVTTAGRAVGSTVGTGVVVRTDELACDGRDPSSMVEATGTMEETRAAMVDSEACKLTGPRTRDRTITRFNTILDR